LRKNLASFSLGNIITKLNRIHVEIRSKHNRPFPKLREPWLSEYNYQRRHIKIHPDGRIAGGLSRFVSSMVDFSFIRSINSSAKDDFAILAKPKIRGFNSAGVLSQTAIIVALLKHRKIKPRQ
jgi:hypothetical protein